MRKGTLSVLCAVTAVLFLCCPALFMMGTQNIVVQRWLNGGRLAYEGKLVIWSVDAKVDGKQALLSWIKARAAFFESRNFGVYPKIENPMTMEDVRSRMANGECPDVLLCGGDVPQEVLAHATVYEGPFLMAPVLPQSSGGLLTPLMQSGTVLMINEDALYRAGLSPPAGLEGMESQWIEQTLTQLPGAFGHEDGTSLMATVVSELPAEAQQAVLKSKTCDMSGFLRGDVAVFVCSQKALWELYKQELLGKTLPGVITYPLSGFSARVEYAMLMQNENTRRQSAAASFITVLLGRQAQTALADIYALPVVKGTTCPRVDLASLWQKAEDTTLICPNSAEQEFLNRLSAGETLESLRAFVQEHCQPPP